MSPAADEQVEVEAAEGKLKVALPYSAVGALVGAAIATIVGLTTSNRVEAKVESEVTELFAHRLAERERVDADLEARMRAQEIMTAERLSKFEGILIGIANRLDVPTDGLTKNGKR